MQFKTDTVVRRLMLTHEVTSCFEKLLLGVQLSMPICALLAADRGLAQ